MMAHQMSIMLIIIIIDYEVNSGSRFSVPFLSSSEVTATDLNALRKLKTGAGQGGGGRCVTIEVSSVTNNARALPPPSPR
jgi:hypothetical protein